MRTVSEEDYIRKGLTLFSYIFSMLMSNLRHLLLLAGLCVTFNKTDSCAYLQGPIYGCNGGYLYGFGYEYFTHTTL